jgi:GT2 family glycosyltransferase
VSPWLAPLRGLRQLFQSWRYGRKQLVAVQHLQPVPGDDRAYDVTGDDPQFLLECPLPAGWVRLDYRLQTQGDAQLEIYLDHGEGFAPETCVEREMVEGATERTRYLYLPRPVRALRFDPVNKPGRIRLDHFEVRSLRSWEVLPMALRGKFGLLFKYGCFGPALWRGVKLLLGGRFREFGRKIYDGLHGMAADCVADYSREPAYRQWRENNRLTDTDRARLRAEAAALAKPPLISILMPTYNTPAGFLRKAINSVLRQTYPHWQLCIADDGSTAPHVRRLLEEYAAQEPRITLVWRKECGNISAATNSALEVARGEYIALLDHDDELAEQALSRVARALVADPTLDMVYSDEDKIQTDGSHCDPFFKPDWSPEYLLACMYTCHLGVYRTSLARAINGFRSEFDQAQDYDFVLRFTSRTQRIAHIPDILYHWRISPTSSASGPRAKPKAQEIAARALRAWLGDNGHEGTVEPAERPGFHRVRFAIKGTPTISVVIPSGCRRATLHGKETWFVARCVESIRQQTTYPRVEILVLYNQTIEPELASTLERLGVRLINYDRPGPFNLSDKINVGASLASGEQLVLLNDDIEVLTPDWLESMLEYSQLEGIGAVGARLLFPNGRLQHGGVLIPGGNPTHAFYAYPSFHPGYFNSQVVVRNWIAVTGACLMTRAEVFREVGGFNLSFPLNYNDVDYCLRLRERGLRSVCTPYARLIHHESVTKDGFFPVEVAAFHKQWLAKLPQDPYYNPNFDQGGHDFRIDPRRVVS